MKEVESNGDNRKKFETMTQHHFRNKYNKEFDMKKLDSLGYRNI